MHSWQRLLLLPPTALAFGCATAPRPHSDLVAENLRKRDQVPRLIIQVCTPKDVSLAILETVDRGDGVGSVSASLPREIGRTELNQSVHETYSALPGELVANVIRLKGNDMQFVFLPTQFSATSSWTTWLNPHHASTDRMVVQRELRGNKYAIVPTPEPAPKVRYRLMPFRDYLTRVQARREGVLKESVDPC